MSEKYYEENEEYGYYEEQPTQRHQQYQKLHVTKTSIKRKLVYIGILAGCVLFVVGGVLYVVERTMSIGLLLIEIAWTSAFAAAPLLAITWGVVVLIRLFNKPYVTHIQAPGTNFQNSLGDMTIISPEQLVGMEKQRTRLQLPRPSSRTVPFIAVNEDNRIYEGPQQVVLPPYDATEEEEDEELSHAQEVVATAQERATIARIQQLRGAGMSLRDIAVQVKLSGARYKRFKALCAKAGIQAPEREV